MSIADKITRLTTARSNISTAITNKGGTVESGAGFEDFSDAIATIPTGSGAQPDIAFNADRSTVTFKDGLTKIPDGCCYKANLTSMPTIPASVTEFGKYAFAQTQMENLVVPANISFGHNVFEYNYNLKSITFATGFNLTKIPSHMFYNCGSSSFPMDIVLPDSVTELSDFAFSSCYIKSINLDNVTKIDSYAFGNNNYLRGIETLELRSIDYLGGNAFAYNYHGGLKEVRIHTTPSSVGSSVFYSCQDLTDIYVPWSSGTHSTFDSNLKNGNSATIHYDTVWYDMEATVVNGDISGVPADVMNNKQYTFTITPNAGYMLPTQITVSGATYTYDSSAGTITLTSISGDVSISVSCPTVSVTAITPVVTNGTGVASTQTMGYDDTATVTFTPGDGYYQPFLVTVAGAEYTYNRTLGTVTLTHPYASTIRVTAECSEYEYADIYTVVIPQSKAGVSLYTYYSSEHGGTIYWGDGTSKHIDRGAGGPAYITYSSAGTYNILYVSDDDSGEGIGLAFDTGDLGEYVTRIVFADNRKEGVPCKTCKQIKEMYIPKSIVIMNTYNMFPPNIEKIIFEDASTLTNVYAQYIQYNNDNVELFANASYDSLLNELKNSINGYKVLHCTDGDYYWVQFQVSSPMAVWSIDKISSKAGETATYTLNLPYSDRLDFDENGVSFTNCSGSYVVNQDLKQMEITVGNYTGKGLVNANAVYHSYNITASTTGGTGVLSADTISYDGSVTYTVTPITGYIVESVSCTGADAELVDNVVTITNPTSDVVLTVTCIEDADRTITTTVTHGTFTQSAQTMRYDDTVTVSITPDEGYYQPTSVIVTNAISSWDRGTGTLTITKATGDVTVTAICRDVEGIVLDASWLYNHPTDIKLDISNFELIDDDYISYDTTSSDPYWYFSTDGASILDDSTLKYRYCDITYKSDISGTSQATLYLCAVAGGNSTSYDFVGDNDWHTLTIDTQNNPYRTQMQHKIRVDIPDNGYNTGNVCIKELFFYN